MRPKTEARFDDLLWKSILADLFPDFLELCHPALYKKMDSNEAVVFHDKEFPRLYPAGKGKKRHADLVAKVQLKTGERVAIIVHVEAQGYPDATFPYRMEVYNYRTHDRYQLPVESIALLTDNDPDFRPSEFRQKVISTERVLKFKSIKLMDYSPEKLQKSGKLFAIALEAAWYGLKSNKLKDESLMSVKMDLLRRLRRRHIEREKIIVLLSFIQAVVRFDEHSNDAIFGAELDNLEKDFAMESTTELQMPRTFSAWISIKDQELKDAVKKERRRVQHEMRKRMEAELQKADAERQKADAERQKADADKIKAIRILLNKNLSIADICEAMGVTEDFVRSLSVQQ